jgi:hypothetical protein
LTIKAQIVGREQNARSKPSQQGVSVMNINEDNSVYRHITRVINELRMARQSVTVYKVVELTGIDQFTVFRYFYEKGLLRGK